MAAESTRSFALRSDGMVIGWSGNGTGSTPLQFPTTLSHVKAIAAGGLSPPVVLVLTAWPVILQDPQSLIVDEGATATLNVVAGGGPLRFQWQRNGDNFSGAMSTTPTLGN